MNIQALKDKTTYLQRVYLWGNMDIFIQNIKNKKIRDYWKKNGTPHPHLKYNDLIVNPYLYEKSFDNYMFLRRCLETFRHCINMALDDDVDEYLNSLEAIRLENLRKMKND